MNVQDVSVARPQIQPYYVEGKDTGIIDLVLVGEVDRENLQDLVEKTERYINRKIRYLVLSEAEYQNMKEKLEKRPNIVLWQEVRS